MSHRALTAAVVASLAITATAAMSCPDHTASFAAAFAPAHSAAIVTSWKPRAWQPRPASTADQGMVIEIDPVTGELVAPNPGAMRHATPTGLVRDNNVVIQHRADGSSFARLDERHMDYTVVQIGADGTPIFTCVHGDAEATHAATPAPRSASKRKGAR